jgi:hypothetical protein
MLNLTGYEFQASTGNLKTFVNLCFGDSDTAAVTTMQARATIASFTANVSLVRAVTEDNATAMTSNKRLNMRSDTNFCTLYTQVKKGNYIGIEICAVMGITQR